MVGSGLNGGYDGMMAEVLTADCILSQDDLLVKISDFWTGILNMNIPLRLSWSDNTNSDHMQLGKGKKAPTARGDGVGLESKNRGGAL